MPTFLIIILVIMLSVTVVFHCLFARIYKYFCPPKYSSIKNDQEAETIEELLVKDQNAEEQNQFKVRHQQSDPTIIKYIEEDTNELSSCQQGQEKYITNQEEPLRHPVELSNPCQQGKQTINNDDYDDACQLERDSSKYSPKDATKKYHQNNPTGIRSPKEDTNELSSCQQGQEKYITNKEEPLRHPVELSNPCQQGKQTINNDDYDDACQLERHSSKYSPKDATKKYHQNNPTGIRSPKEDTNELSSCQQGQEKYITNKEEPLRHPVELSNPCQQGKQTINNDDYDDEHQLERDSSKYSPKHATKMYHQKDQIKTHSQKQQCKTDYQDIPKNKSKKRSKKRKAHYPLHNTETYNKEAQTKTGSKEELSRFGKPKLELDDSHPNLDFYQNNRKSEPDGDYIENILKEWFRNYYKLEYHHGYIQWLFPNKVAGLNRQAFCLNDYEIEMISGDEKLRNRVIRSFRLMLDFYGMEMNDDCQFTLLDPDSKRIKNLKESRHNFLRITRILIALGEFGLKKEQKNWLDFLTDLVDKGILKEAEYSLQNFWIPAVQDF